jgi:hypothetical protein
METHEVHEVLVRARNLIDRHGWQQGDMGNANEGYCIEGACRAAGSDYGDWSEVRAPLGIAIPFVWNDEPGRTKEEVLAVLDAAIAATAPPPLWVECPTTKLVTA